MEFLYTCSLALKMDKQKVSMKTKMCHIILENNFETVATQIIIATFLNFCKNSSFPNNTLHINICCSNILYDSDISFLLCETHIANSLIIYRCFFLLK